MTRSYKDACGMARALDVVGERWAMHVVRELVFGPKRFTDLKSALVGISSNVLTQRLEDLEHSGVLTRRKLPPPAASRVYELTTWGAQLGPVIDLIGRWGAQSPFTHDDPALSNDALALSFRNMFQPERASGLRATYALHVEDDRYVVSIDDGAIDVSRGEPTDPVAVITGSAEVLGAVAYLGHSMPAAVDAGDLSTTGDPDAAEEFFSLFGLPEPAPVG